MYGSGRPTEGPRRWTDIWSAGHSVSAVEAVMSVADLVAATRAEYQQAKAALTGRGAGPGDD